MSVSTPIILDGGNQATEGAESTPETDTTIEMGPPPSTSSDPPAMSTPESNNLGNPADARDQFCKSDIEADPGLRKPIESLDPNIRDAARRIYINMGPCQPTDHKYKKTPKENLQKQEAFMLIGSRTMATGWNIVLVKKQPFVSIAFFLSNQERKIMVLRHSQG
mgnify:CR=1 FL=1